MGYFLELKFYKKNICFFIKKHMFFSENFYYLDLYNISLKRFFLCVTWVILYRFGFVSKISY